MWGRGETIRIARRLRAAVNLDQGFIDIDACLRIADDLENADFYRREKRKTMRKVRVGKSYTNPDAITPAITGAELVQIFNLKALEEGVLVEKMLKNPEEIVTIEMIASIFGVGGRGARNRINKLRFHFEYIGFSNIILNKKGKGYFMSKIMSQDINEFILAWKKSFVLDV